jgi:hypothetical protein
MARRQRALTGNNCNSTWEETMPIGTVSRQLMFGAAGAIAVMLVSPASARDVSALMTKALGSTNNPGPVVAEAVRRAAIDLTPD